MASLDPKYAPTSDPNYMGALKEPSRFDFNGGQKYDNLFQGLTQGFNGVVSGVDNLIKESIKSDVYEAVDKIRGAQGVDTDVNTVRNGGTAGQPPNATVFRGGPAGPDATGGSGGPNPLAANRPPNQEQIAGDYARIKAAYDQGKISDRNYMTQLEVMNRSLRSRYPGFRDEVDAMVQSVTGVTPANALRKAILSDLQSAQSNADALTKERQKLLIQHADVVPADAMQREAAGNPYSMAELFSYIQPAAKRDADIKAAKADLELKASKNADISSDALQTASTVLGNMQQQMLTNLTSNNTVAAFMKKITDAQASGKVLTPEETQQMTAQFQQMKYNVRAAMEAAFNAPLTPGSKQTLRFAINDQNKINQLIEAQMEPFKMVEEALTKNDLGLFNVSTNAIKNMQNADQKKIMESSGYFRAIPALKALGGDAVTQWLISRPESGIADEGIKATLQVFKTLNLTGGQHSQAGTTSWEEQFKQLSTIKGGTSAKTVNQYVSDRVHELTDPSVPPQLKANAAKVAFSPENINFLNKFQAADGSQSKVFGQLVSPAVTKAMLQLRDSTPEGKQTWDNYSMWAKNNFMGLFKQSADGINSSSNRNWLQVNWNPNSKQFEVTPTEEGIRANSGIPGSAGTSLVNLIEGRLSSGVVDAVNKMNLGIKSIDPVLTASGYKTEDEIKKLVNFNALKHKESGFWSTIVKSINGPNAVKGEADDLFGGTPANFTQPPGGKAGRLSTEKDPSSEVVNKRGADLENLSGKADKMLNGLINEGVVDKLAITSGYRDPDRNSIAGGAKRSAHLHGDAIDLSIAGYTDAQKTAVLEAAIKHGAKGIGIYPGGTSLHIDTRDTPTTWGYSPWGKYKGVHWSAQPEWAHGPLKKLFGE